MTIEDITKQFCRDLETAIRADVEEKIRAAFSAPAEARKSTNAMAGHSRAALETADEIARLCRTCGTISRAFAQKNLKLSMDQWKRGIRSALDRGLVVQSGTKRGAVYSLYRTEGHGVAV